MRPCEPPSGLANEINALLQGNPSPAAASLDRLQGWPLDVVQETWWEISTLYGRVAGQLEVQWGNDRFPYSLGFAPLMTTGGPPREIANPEALIHAWRAVLSQPPSRELHRHNMAETLAALRAGTHPQPDSADALLRHHTELPIDWLKGRKPVGTGPHERPEWEAVLDLLPLVPVLDSQEAFDAHVRAGLDSPSLPRRDLCWRLTRL